MDPMSMAVYASTILKQLNDAPCEGRQRAERWQVGPAYGLRDVLRVATAVGAIAAYAGILALGTR